MARISPDGIVTKFTAGIPQHADLRGITIGADGNIWFAEHGARAIAKITPSGAVTQYQLKVSPYAVTTGPDHNVWFTDPARNIVGHITPTGDVIQYAIARSGDVLQGEGLWSIASQGKYLWVIENARQRIARISPQGVVTEFSTHGHAPNAITAAGDGALWLSEDGSRIGRMATDGRLTEYSIGSVATSRAGATKSARAVTAGFGGTVWFALDDGAVVRTDAHGKFTRYETGAQPEPSALGFDLHGRLWLADRTGGTLIRLAK